MTAPRPPRKLAITDRLWLLVVQLQAIREMRNSQ
jgi:hypothetical protein